VICKFGWAAKLTVAGLAKTVGIAKRTSASIRRWHREIVDVRLDVGRPRADDIFTGLMRKEVFEDTCK